VSSKQPIILTDEIIQPPALVRAGLDALPSIIRAQGERAGRRFIEFFTANIRNRNTRMAYACAVKQFFDWCDERKLELVEIEPLTDHSSVRHLYKRFIRRDRPQRVPRDRRINSFIS